MQQTRSLLAFGRLNAACDELKIRQDRALPVEEREACFICIRGLMLPTDGSYEPYIDQLRVEQPRHADSVLMAFSFAPSSQDARIKEGAFLLAITNEAGDLDLDMPWRRDPGMWHRVQNTNRMALGFRARLGGEGERSVAFVRETLHPRRQDKALEK